MINDKDQEVNVVRVLGCWVVELMSCTVLGSSVV